MKNPGVGCRRAKINAFYGVLEALPPLSESQESGRTARLFNRRKRRKQSFWLCSLRYLLFK